MKNPCNEILIDIESGGFPVGELAVIAAGRGTGKSVFTDHYIKDWLGMFDVSAPKYEILITATVDGETWYTVNCTRDISQWIRTTFPDLEDKQWFQTIDDKWTLYSNRFDLHEELYTMLQLRW